MAPEELSAYPLLRGVPWWAAVLTAVGATLLGIVYDAVIDGKNLSSVFAVLYFLGCVAAVLVVRQSSVFTAVVQPPLILFVAVPGAYYLFHRDEIKGIKDILINCGYPLIERFLLMFTTSVVVLLIGMARWYFGSASRRPARAAAETDTTAAGTGVGAKVAALLGLAGAAGAKAMGAIRGGGDDEETAARRGRSAREETPPRRRPQRSTEHAAHARPPADPNAPRRRRPVPEGYEDAVARRRRPAPEGYEEAVARRRRPAPEGYSEPPPRRRPPREGDPNAPRYRDAPPPRRRPAAEDGRRPSGDGPRREYLADRPRYEGGPGYRGEDPRRDGPREQGRPRPRPNPYAEERPEPRQRPAPGGTHHPVSRVRYRGEEPGDDGYHPRPSRHSRD